jgi:cbb3-type cytochrome c oxidase subunit III
MMGRNSVLCILAAVVLTASLLLLPGGATAADAPAAGQAVKNPFAGKADAIKEGERVFDAKCAECHGGDAMGQSGPDLTDDKWIYGGTDAEVFETVTNGRKGGMPSWKRELSTDDIWKVITYIRSLSKK